MTKEVRLDEQSTDNWQTDNYHCDVRIQIVYVIERIRSFAVAEMKKKTDVFSVFLVGYCYIILVSLKMTKISNITRTQQYLAIYCSKDQVDIYCGPI